VLLFVPAYLDISILPEIQIVSYVVQDVLNVLELQILVLLVKMLQTTHYLFVIVWMDITILMEQVIALLAGLNAQNVQELLQLVPNVQAQ
jgi:hypothetical protein